EPAIRDLARFTSLRVAVMYGGVGYGRQKDALRTGVDVLVATPGRLLDHMQQGVCKLDHVKYLVLDEADRMLDMGFLPDVRRILDRCPRDRHTSLFSATIPPEIETLIKWAMRNPQTIEIGARRTPAETVKHVIYPVSDAQKTDLLLELLKRVNYESVLVFCRTKHGADRVAHLLKRSNHAIERFISATIPRVKLENFEYRYTALFEEGKPGSPSGGGSRVRGARVRGGYFYGPAKRRR